jgi:hypothetical protein
MLIGHQRSVKNQITNYLIIKVNRGCPTTTIVQIPTRAHKSAMNSAFMAQESHGTGALNRHVGDEPPPSVQLYTLYTCINR